MARQEARFRLPDPQRLLAQNVPASGHSAPPCRERQEGTELAPAAQTPEILPEVLKCVLALSDLENEHLLGGVPLRDQSGPIQPETTDD